MVCSNQVRFRQQVRFLQRQFLQNGDLPFTDVLSADVVSQALAAAGVVWKDRVYTPLVTLWIFLGQVHQRRSFLSSCRCSVRRSSSLTGPASVFLSHGRLLPGEKTTARRVLRTHRSWRRSSTSPSVASRSGFGRTATSTCLTVQPSPCQTRRATKRLTRSRINKPQALAFRWHEWQRSSRSRAVRSSI